MSRPVVNEQAFFVLTALADAPRYGYAIRQEAEALSSGRVKLSVSSLYAVLDRLTAEELIERDRDEVADGRLRRYYRITSQGAQVLRAEAARLAANARVADQRLRQGKERWA
ncbi:PadR family transcriptional regulator [Longispora albida]|uniref:PadR family transcriptional regulator n=1 Tax=Longispora albida TaxID=203523 RepID=UPI0003AA5D79|nr:PadR family transcriptional regulator [Longispora albida]